MERISDEMIMLKVRDGNLAELAELFERYHLKLYNFFLKLTFDKAASHDLTQNLFYRIIKYRHSFRDEGNFKSWIYQLARNQHIDYYHQKQKSSGRYAYVDPSHENIPDFEKDFEEDDYEKLDKALMKLNPDHLELIVLSRYQGLKYEEISKIRDMSVTAIKVQVHRAIKQLREIYFKQV